MAKEKFRFNSYEQAKSFVEKLSNSDAYEGYPNDPDGYCEYHYVEVDTDKVKDFQAIRVFAGTRGGTTLDN